MKFLFLCCACILVIQGASAIVLKDVIVPEMVLLSDTDGDGDIDDTDVEDVVLDCDYVTETTDKNLVVKWFKDNDLIYQWIQDMKPTIPSHAYRDKIDETFEVSEDPKSRYRAIKFKYLSIEDSGYYKCDVHTRSQSVHRERHLQVIDVSNHTMDLNFLQKDNETHVECTVGNVYPKPTIAIMTEDDDIIDNVKDQVTKQDNGFYSATTVAVLPQDEEDDDTSFKCVTFFGNLPFNLTESTSDDSTMLSPRLSILHLLFVIIPLWALA